MSIKFVPTLHNVIIKQHSILMTVLWRMYAVQSVESCLSLLRYDDDDLHKNTLNNNSASNNYTSRKNMFQTSKMQFISVNAYDNNHNLITRALTTLNYL